MKKLALLAAVAVSFLFAGCATTGAQSPAQLAAAFQLQVSKACSVVQPTLLSVQAMTVQDPTQRIVLAEVVNDNAAICAANASLDPTSVKNLINTSIPAAIQVVGLLPIDQATKTTVEIGLLAFQTALSAALVQYGAPAVAPVPASAPVVASDALVAMR